jgi:galactitol-specific phosphotransferase system IIB component
MSSVEKKFYGVASSTVSTMRLVGHMFSMGLVMFILSTHMGKVKITPDKFGLFLTSSKIAFSIFSFLCFLGIFASLARGKIRK